MNGCTTVLQTPLFFTLSCQERKVKVIQRNIAAFASLREIAFLSYTLMNSILFSVNHFLLTLCLLHPAMPYIENTFTKTPKLMKNAVLFLLCNVLLLGCKPKEEASEPAADVKSPQAEFADPKYADIGKQSLEKLASGDIDGFVSAFADNAVYSWSAGDSLAGKSAIVAYWKERRGNVIDTLTFTNDIWLSIKVNESQKGPDTPGIWLLGWWQTSVTYKNGKSLTFWTHTDYHFNSNDQVDRVVQYIDRAPIVAALATQ